MKKLTRRNLISKVAFASSIPLTQALTKESRNYDSTKLSINKNDTILFQGDSIIDAFRTRAELPRNHQRSFGVGFVHNVATKLLGSHPNKSLTIYNRGMGGHKVFQLIDRWQEDTLDLKPTILTIIIGINDYFHFTEKNIPTSQYYEDYKSLLNITTRTLPTIKLIIGEPFTIDNPKIDRSRLRHFQEYSRQIAEEFNAIHMPLQSIFDDALKTKDRSYWSREGDGIHPSTAGSFLLSEKWLSYFE